MQVNYLSDPYLFVATWCTVPGTFIVLHREPRITAMLSCLSSLHLYVRKARKLFLFTTLGATLLPWLSGCFFFNKDDRLISKGTLDLTYE